MNIYVIAVGKIREKYIEEGIKEFTKRIKPFCPLKIIEIEAESIKNNELKALECEADKILSQINDSAYAITLEIEKNQLSSTELAEKISNINAEGINQLIFIIGGATGLSQRVKKRANYSLSLSKMTFPHQLARLILLEQLYRAFKIINNEPYHK